MKDVVIARKKRSQRRLIASAVFSLTCLGVGGSIGLSGIELYDARQARKAELESQRSGVSSQTQQMRQDAKEGASAVRLYSFLTRNQTGKDFSLNRDLLTQRLSDMRLKYHFSQLDLSAAPVQEVAGSSLQLRNGKEISMQVDLQIQAVSDVYVIAFLNDLMVQLPGYVEVVQLEINKQGELSADTLMNVAQNPTAISPLVQAKLRFVWHGIKPVADPAATAGGTP